MLLVAAQDGRWHRAHTALAGADCKNQTLRGIPPPAPGQNCHKQGSKTALGRKELL